MADPGDPVIQSTRAQIAAIDLGLLEALNERVRLVRRIKEHKEAHGIGFRDPAQEERLLAALCAANPGPVSEEGLRVLWAFLLEWTKREVARPGETQAE